MNMHPNNVVLSKLIDSRMGLSRFTAQRTKYHALRFHR